MKTASIYSKVNPEKEIFDLRLRTRGFSFGKISTLSSQYGINIEQNGSIFKFSAPKSRLQMFAEKLHFAQIPFWE
jgi:hypothetical protein